MSVAPQAPLFMGFPRQEYWSGLPFPSPGDLPYPGIELGSRALQADSLLTEPPASVLAYTSNKPEGGFQNGTCQHQCPCDRMKSPERLLPASVSPVWVPVASFLSRRLCKFSKWVWPRLLSHYCFCPGAGVCEILYVSFRSGVSISHSPLAFPKLSPTGLQCQTFCGLIFQEQDPWAWKPDVGLRSLALWREALQL